MPGPGGVSQCRRVCLRPAEPQMVLLRVGASFAPAPRDSSFYAPARAWAFALTPSRRFPAVGKSAPLRCSCQNGGGAFRGGDMRRCHARPCSVSFPVARSWKLLCAAWLTAIRFQLHHCQPGKSSTG